MRSHRAVPASVLLSVSKSGEGMTLKTCLLLSDDPDDHIEFTEALHEVAENSVVIIVMNADKATRLLAMKKVIPDLVIVDITLTGLDSDSFFDTMQNDPQLGIIPLVVYGELSELQPINHTRISVFLDNSITYSGLRKALLDLLDCSSSG